jgi:anion-transporting  ArsA/GET3 family ATPase
MTLPGLLDQRRVVLCVGSGGVGKTTTSAALAVAAARRGRRTAVLTVDPAQRLRDALGLGERDDRLHTVHLAGGARLDAMLLDVKRTFDELVVGLASSPAQAQRILDNRLYQNLSGTLAGSAEYMAVESVLRLAETGEHDLLVVDTPPARHAVDFLDAPRRLLALLDSRAFAILKDPSSILPAAPSRLASMVLTGILRGLERFTGIGLVREVGEFVRVIEDLTEGLRARVAQVDALIKSDTTALLLVTAPEPHLVGETEELAQALAAVHLRVHGVVVNRMVPSVIYGPGAPKPQPPGDIDAPFRRRLERAFDDLRALAARQDVVLEPLLRTAGAPVLAEVPMLTTPPGSLADLEKVAGYLVPDLAAVSSACSGAPSSRASSATADRPGVARPRAGRP